MLQEFLSSPTQPQLDASTEIMNRVSDITGLPTSPTDIDVLARLQASDLKIYCGGISTAGIFEIAAALANPDRHITATSIDDEGIAFTKRQIEKVGTQLDESISDRISVLHEDFTGDLSPAVGSMDAVYTRLALHYVPPVERAEAMRRLVGLVRAQGAVAIAVRSVESMNRPNVLEYDQATGRAKLLHLDGSTFFQVRHLLTLDDLRIEMEASGVELVDEIRHYTEDVYVDYQRSDYGAPDHVLFGFGRKSA